VLIALDTGGRAVGGSVIETDRGLALVRRILIVCGLVAPVLYIVTDIIASSQYPGYRYADQQISELLAKGAQSRPFMVAANLIPFDLLVAAFAAGIWAAVGRTRAGRVAAAGLVGFAVFGTLGGGVFEMERREVMAAGQGTLRGTMHLPATGLMTLCLLVAMIFGARLLGKRFRYYTYATIVTMLGFGFLVAAQAGQLGTGQPTPWMGLEERVSSYSMMLWLVVLAIALLRAQQLTIPRRLEKSTRRQTVTPQAVTH
jgi:hypothetical membrane protein